MLNNMTIKSRLVFVISLLSLLLVGVGGLGLYGINKSNESLKGVYQDRAVPLGDLALIVDRMQRIRLNTAMASYGRDIEIAKQRKDLTNQRDAEITATWQKYLATNLTSIEKTLIESFN
ncbi:MAG: MCP four helix bundle domain-containing protein, partial [Nitrosomonas sp.]|nr:MCP four helix bundle domain-containing protein [Nitrosomonas sp.]